MIRAMHDAVKREDWGRAWQLGNRILNEAPDKAEALYLMGATLRAMNNLGLALNCLSKALATERKQPNLWMTYAATLHDLNRWEDAERAFSVVQTMLPTDPMPPANIAATYVQRGKWRDAINWCDEALKLDPDNHIARITKAFACLSLGRWKDGWQYAEALYGTHLNVRVYQGEGEWDGSPGKTVVVQCDQGIGDQIMFAQCLPEMQKVCKEVIVDTSPRMVGVIQRNFPGVTVYGTLKETAVAWLDRHKIDAHVSVSLLGRWYRNKDSDFPRKPYVKPDAALYEKWCGWLKQFGKPSLGVAWKGGIQATQNHLRSMSLADMAPLLTTDRALIDLSYQDTNDEVARWNIDNKAQIIRPPVNVNDYDDTIALVAALDAVATVTTSVVHVCGALGRTAHVMVPEVAQWRYAYRCSDGMVWYPKDSVKLHRQTPGEIGWAPTVKRVAECV